jgi:hypothetical protein
MNPRSWIRVLGFRLGLAVSLWSAIGQGHGACESCGDFQPQGAWGTAMVDTLTEASGIALSARNPGVLWAHNDGSRQRIFALSTNGALLASFNLRKTVEDVEGIAVGPGPISGVSYLYVGDIGGDTASGASRDRVQVLRVPEPVVDPSWAGDPSPAISPGPKGSSCDIRTAAMTRRP